MAERPIGVFDSGVGGLTVFKAIEKMLPHESLIYLGDTARVPYGPKSPDTVARYSTEAAHFMAEHRVKMLVVACNSASSVGLDGLQRDQCPVLGVIGPGARHAVQVTRNGKIGVIGTRATIASGAYERAIRQERPDATVVSQACPLLVPLAEEGWTDNDISRQVCDEYFGKLRRAEVDTLVLGCTHYPLLRNTIASSIGPDVQLVDSAESVASEVGRRLEEAGIRMAEADSPPYRKFFVTDSPEPFRNVAERFLGRPVELLEQVRIEGE